MEHAFSDLHFDPPAPSRICRVIDGHDIVIEHFVEFDGDWWGSLHVYCDGEDVAFTGTGPGSYAPGEYAKTEFFVIQRHWHANHFDTPELAEVLANALARHLAGKAVR